MSGLIFGYVDLVGNKIDSLAIKDEIMMSLGKYKLDKWNYICRDNFAFGCGLLDIVDCNDEEVLPYESKEDNLILLADAIIDNREELLGLLGIDNHNVDDYSDSEYILMAYKKYGEDCTKYLIGDYSFVIYNTENNTVQLFADHTGTRCLYYYKKGNILMFSTVYTPIVKHFDLYGKFNDRWITDFLAMNFVKHNTEARECIYEGIYQVEPAHYIEISDNNIYNILYWDTSDIQVNKNLTEEEYIEGFMKVYNEAIECRLRTNKNVAIMLSGGLDSASIATIATKKLKKQNKKLKAYTSIPSRNYVTQGGYYIEDESKEVEELVEYCGNIDLTLCSCEGEDPYKHIDELVDIIEGPYKIIENSYWLNYITKKASEDNCKVILTGQYGNSTISYGDFLVNIKTLLDERKYIKAIKEINAGCKVHNFPRKRIMKIIYKYINNINDEDNGLELSSVKKELIDKYDVIDRFKELEILPESFKAHSHEEVIHAANNPTVFSHLSQVDTKWALAYGVIKRDPTRDKRVIEYLMTLPSNMFVKDGIERYLIRKSMEGKLPDSIRMNINRRGLQAADYMQRLEPYLQNIKEEIIQALNSNEIQKYIDIDKIKASMDKLNLDKNNNYYVRMFLVILIFYRFIEHNNK